MSFVVKQVMAWAKTWGMRGEEYWLKTRRWGGGGSGGGLKHKHRATLQESDESFVI